MTATSHRRGSPHAGKATAFGGFILATAAALTAGTAVSTASPSRSASGAQEPAARARPNILFLLIDDMGYGDLGVTGNTAIATPNIDALAKGGVLMTQFYDAAPICSPSRAGFFTGQFPARVRFHNYIHGTKPDALVGQADWLDPKVPTLARAMKDAGYRTAHIGKWHMGGTRDITDAPAVTAYGFDEGFTNQGGGPNGSSSAERIPAPQRTATYVTRTLDFVKRSAGRPWFVQLWTNDVHEPWRPSPEQLQVVAGKGRNPLETQYFATVANLDREVGRLVAGLKAAGQFDNTLIVITSDNGPTARSRFYANGKSPPGSTAMFRGRKNSLYEGGTRQPLIIHWPGHVAAGTRDATTIAQAVDLFPSLAEAAGAKAPSRGDGISLWRAWRGQPIAQRPDLYWTYGAYGPYNAWTRAGKLSDRSPGFAIRSGKWKLLAEGDGGRAELYDLSRDPSETTNLAGQQPAVAKAMTAKLVAWAKSLPVRPSLAPPNDEQGADDTE